MLRVRGGSEADSLLCKQFIRVTGTIDSSMRGPLRELRPMTRSGGPFSVSEAGGEAPCKALHEQPIALILLGCSKRTHFWSFG